MQRRWIGYPYFNATYLTTSKATGRGRLDSVQRSRILGSIGVAWSCLTLAAIAYATRLGLFLAPVDALQGNVFRIFFYHVPHSMLSLLFPYVNFIASLFYLYWRRRDPLKALNADAVAIASAEVTVVYALLAYWARRQQAT